MRALRSPRLTDRNRSILCGDTPAPARWACGTLAVRSRSRPIRRRRATLRCFTSNTWTFALPDHEPARPSPTARTRAASRTRRRSVLTVRALAHKRAAPTARPPSAPRVSRCGGQRVGASLRHCTRGRAGASLHPWPRRRGSTLHQSTAGASRSSPHPDGEACRVRTRRRAGAPTGPTAGKDVAKRLRSSSAIVMRMPLGGRSTIDNLAGCS